MNMWSFLAVVFSVFLVCVCAESIVKIICRHKERMKDD